MSIPETAPSYRELFRHRPYQRIWVGLAISYAGDTLTRVALPIYVYQLTGDATALGVMFAMQQIPWVFLGPLAGVLADRWNRKRLLVGVVLLEGACVALLPFASSIGTIYLLGFLAVVAQVVEGPVRTAAIPDVIGPRLFARAVSVSVVTVQTLDTAGSALAGVFVAAFGPVAAFLADTATFVIHAVLLGTLRIPTPPRTATPLNSVWDDFKDGVHFTRNEPALAFLLGLMVIRGATMIGVIPLLPAFVTVDLRATALELGLISAAASLGYSLSSIAAVRFSRLLTPTRILLVGSAVSGLLMVPFWWLRSLPPLLILRFGSALAYGAGNLVANVGIVKLSPSEIRGRVDSTSWAIIKLSQVSSSASLGFMADRLGAAVVIGLGGIALSCIMGAIAIFRPRRPAHEWTID